MNDQSVVASLQATLRIAQRRSVLVALEPRVTAPSMYSQRNFERYGYRFAASPMWADELKGETFLWPQDLQRVESVTSTNIFAATIICAEKRSALPGSLYGLRRAVIRECENMGVSLGVFGNGWNLPALRRTISGAKALTRAIGSGRAPDIREALGDLGQKPQFWCGTVAAKNSAFATAPVTIVIENSLDYVSEKLIDAVKAGVTPIYIGPPLELFGLPESIAVTCAPEPTEIVQTLQSLTPQLMRNVEEEGRRWLSSHHAGTHEIGRVLLDLGRRIGAVLSS